MEAVIEEIKTQIENRGLTRISVNIPGLYLYYTTSGDYTYIILLANYTTGEEFNREQYQHILKQIKSNFTQKSYTQIELLNLICTKEINKVKYIWEDSDNYWIVDGLHNQLVIYENQKSDFLNLKEMIEDVINREPVQQIQLEKENVYYNNLNKSNEINDAYSRNKDRYNHQSEKNADVLKYFSLFNSLIIVANVIVFILIELYHSTNDTEYMLKSGAMYWPYVIHKGEYYRLFTHMFLHFGIAHLANNMIVLFFMGSYLEKIMGKFRYMLIYLGSGLFAGAASMIYNISQNNPVVSAGASGAIFGVVGAMFYVVVVNRGKIKDLTTGRLMMFVLLSLYGGLTSQGTDNMAHIGGFAAGLLLAVLLYRKSKKREVQEE